MESTAVVLVDYVWLSTGRVGFVLVIKIISDRQESFSIFFASIPSNFQILLQKNAKFPNIYINFEYHVRLDTVVELYLEVACLIMSYNNQNSFIPLILRLVNRNKGN